MSKVIYHKARRPGEEDIFEVKTSNHVQYTGRIFFREVKDGIYKEIENEMNDGCDVDEFLPDAAKVLIRDHEAKIVMDKESNTVARLRVGKEYMKYE